MTTQTRPASPAQRIAHHVAAINALNAEFDRYRALQPVAASSVLVGGQGFDSSRLRRKYELALLIDEANVQLERARADLARNRAADLADPDDLASLQRAADDAITASAAADDRARACRVAASDAKAAIDHRRERIRDALAAAAAAAAVADRWQAESERDRNHLSNVANTARIMGAPS